MGYLMGIDLGSTSIKVVVYDYAGNHVASGARPTPLSHLDPNQPSWCVWEPEKIWNCVTESMREALGSMEHPEAVRAVAVTGFGMDGLPLDRAGNPLYPMISWHCPRTIPQSEQLSQKVGARRIFDLTGKQVMSIDSVYRMMWMQQHHPEILEQTDKWLLIEDFINFMLCGEQATDYSMASCTSVYNHAEKSWSKELLDAAGVPLSIFPPVKQSGTLLGNILPAVAQSTGLSKDTRVVLGGHDYICSAYAVGAVDPSVLLDITGTWEMLVQTSNALNISEACFNSGYYLEGHVAKDLYMYVGSTVSGDMTEWMKAQLSADEHLAAQASGGSVWDEISRAVESAPPGSHGCCFLPHFSGANAPVSDPHSMGAFVGLQNCITKADMMRSVFEGLDYQFRMMVESFKKYNLGNPSRIVATGGATRNKFWMQNKADVTGLTLEVPDVYEATPLGAAMLAGIGSGVYKNDAEAVAAVHRPSAIYTPDMELHALYNDYYENIFCKLHEALAPVNKEISARFR